MDIQNYSSASIEQIKQSDFLPKGDWEELVKMQEIIQEDFEKKQIFRTETEMIVSVLNDVKHPTNSSKYWQSVREKSVMFENLVTLSFEYRKNNVEIRKLQKKIKTELDEDENELLVIELEEKLFGKKNMELTAKDRMRELKLWENIKKELDDGSFDIDNVDTHQLISFGQRFIIQFANAMDSGDSSVSEVNNLVGQMVSTLKKAEKEGVLKDILSIMPNKDNQKFILGRCGIDHKFLLI